MKSFKDYVKTNEKQYKYTVKIAADSMDSECTKRVVEALGKVDLLKHDSVFSTPLQENPLDFPSIKNTSVNILEIYLKYPVSTDALERIVSEAMGIQRNFIIAYTENDPRRIYTQQYLERKSEDFKKNYKPKIGTMYDDEKQEKVELYGEKYNNKLLDHMEKERKKRKQPKFPGIKKYEQVIDKSTMSAPSEDMGPIGTNSPIPGRKMGELSLSVDNTDGTNSPIAGRKK